MHEALDGGLNRAREYGAVERDRVSPDGGAVEGELPGSRDTCGKRPWCGVVNEHAGYAVDHGLERAAARERDNRRAAGLRLDRRDAEILFAWEQHGGGSAVQVANLLIGEGSEQLDIRTGAGRQRGQRGAFGAMADDTKGSAREGARLDRHVYALVWNEG